MNRLTHVVLLFPGYISEKPAGHNIKYNTDMIPGVNILSGKASLMSVNGAGGSGGVF